MSEKIAAFVASQLGHDPGDRTLFERALTHSSNGGPNYERLEFLGDRVLGLVIAQLLFDRYPDEPEGKLSRRFNMLVARETCGEIGRALGLADVIRIGKQAREDGANRSDNVIGDVVESLIGAIFIDSGLDEARTFIARAWGPLIERQRTAPRHPKSALQEVAAERNLPVPRYEMVERSGTDHDPRFTVRVTVGTAGAAQAEGASKQEAETFAAAALLEKLP